MVARQCQREMISQRTLGMEAQVLEVIQDLLALNGETPISIKEITERFIELYKDEYKWKITAKWIGNIVHKKLHLRAQRTRDGYVIPLSERPRFDQLFEKYGLAEPPAPEPQGVRVP